MTRWHAGHDAALETNNKPGDAGIERAVVFASLAKLLPVAADVLERRLRPVITRFLNRRVAGYDLRAPNDMTRLYQHVRKGDVVLVDGDLRLSRFVKYVTQSPWSHSAFYVGDELLRRGSPLRDQALAEFGPLADRLLIEALTEEGVVAVPLEKYREHNLRICRPWDIAPSRLDQVIDSVVADLGKPYDRRNFLDLTLMLASPIRFGSLKARTLTSCLGRCTDREVICSGMIARAFERAGYPVSPRHHSQILPRDFDLSPSFQVVNVDALEKADRSPLESGQLVRLIRWGGRRTPPGSFQGPGGLSEPATGAPVASAMRPRMLP